MSAIASLRYRICRPPVVLAFASLLATVFLPVALFAWVILFDEAGLDRVVPAVVFTALLPAVSVALVPASLGGYLYDGKTALKVGTILAGVGALLLMVGCRTLQGNVIC